MWDADFSCVTRELEVKAVYRAIPIGASGLTLKESASHLSLSDEYLHGVRDNVTAGEIIQSFENSDAIVIVNQTGKRLASSEIAGTGCWIQLTDDSSVLDAVQIIVRGDTNGDGIITTADYMRVRKLFRREIELA